MKLDSLHLFNRNETISTLKLIIKIALADNKFTDQERATLQGFLTFKQLKISKKFLLKVRNEKYAEIVSVFENKSNLDRAYSIVKEYANLHGVHPDHEGKVLDAIKSVIETKKKTIKFSLMQSIKRLFFTFSYLWGKEEISPQIKSVLAIAFTILACFFGSMWTSKTISLGIFHIPIIGKLIDPFNIGKAIEMGFTKTEYVLPLGSAGICGLLMFGALSFRNYLPRPNNIRNIIFSIANLFLLSTTAMHLIGRSGPEKGITIFIVISLILILWLGMKEILGFIFVGFFILLIWKIMRIDLHMAWRAFPFIVTSFLGISFQSSNFFDDFRNFSSSFFKKPRIEKELLKEGIELAGSRVVQVTKAAISVGATAAGLPPGTGSLSKSKKRIEPHNHATA